MQNATSTPWLMMSLYNWLESNIFSSNTEATKFLIFVNPKLLTASAIFLHSLLIFIAGEFAIRKTSPDKVVFFSIIAAMLLLLTNLLCSSASSAIISAGNSGNLTPLIAIIAWRRVCSMLIVLFSLLFVKMHFIKNQSGLTAITAAVLSFYPNLARTQGLRAITSDNL